MSIKNFTELDFAALKQSLIDFLKDQDQFRDFDFNASGISVILDLLAYNTEMISFFTNMAANEAFLDTAILRESTVSRAKAIGYRPRSRTSARATVQIDIDPSGGGGDPDPSSILVPQYQKFTSRILDKTYTFQNATDVVLIDDGSGHFIGEISLIEGELLTHTFIADSTIIPKQRFILPNEGIDASTITVKVQQSAAVPVIQSFSLSNDINVVKGNDPVFFLQEVEDKKLEIYFGDGVVGKRLINGNIISVTYVVSKGEAGNGAKTFVPTSSVEGYEDITYTTISNSSGGISEEEDVSIKFLAPLFYETQNRAVNKSDYETLIKKDYPQVEFVRVWGGEDNVPPVYGKVYMSLKPKGALAFSEQEKLSIINSIIRPRSPVSIETVIVEPDYLKLIINSEVKIKSKKTTSTVGQIKAAIIQAIKDYRDENLLGFDSQFRYTKLTKAIDAANASIQNNLTSIKLKYTITPPLNLSQRFEINLNAEIDKGDASNSVSSLNSTGFLKDGLVSYLGDDGKGDIYIYRLVLSKKVIIERNVGTLDYDTGKVIIPSLVVQGIADGSESIDLVFIPASNDLNPVRNQIITILDDDITVTVVDEDK